MKKLPLLLCALGMFAAEATATIMKAEQTINGMASTYLFDDVAETFGLSFQITDPDVDGAWWVVNDGPNPQSQTQGNYAIFYTDLTDVWAYQYAGGWRFNTPGGRQPLIERFSNVVRTNSAGGVTTHSMVLDLTNVNGQTQFGLDWEGLTFDTSIGTWLHATRNAFSGNVCGGVSTTNDSLDCFDGSNWIGWDLANGSAQVVNEFDTSSFAVPEPASVLMLGFGLLALSFRRKVQAK